MNDRLLNRIQLHHVTLTILTNGDMDRVRHWRNKPSVNRYMIHQETITEAQQAAWFKAIESATDQQHFLISYKDLPVGVANLKSVSGENLWEADTLEPAIYLGEDDYRGGFLAFIPALAMNDYCFTRLGCRNLLARVLHDNEAAIRFNKAMGYHLLADQRVINNKMVLLMELNRQDYDLASKKIRAFLR